MGFVTAGKNEPWRQPIEPATLGPQFSLCSEVPSPPREVGEGRLLPEIGYHCCHAAEILQVKCHTMPSPACHEQFMPTPCLPPRGLPSPPSVPFPACSCHACGIRVSACHSMSFSTAHQHTVPQGACCSCLFPGSLPQPLCYDVFHLSLLERACSRNTKQQVFQKYSSSLEESIAWHGITYYGAAHHGVMEVSPAAA